MADPRALEDTWRRTIKKFPSLGDRWGDTLPLNPNGTPVVGAMQEAIDLYRAQKKARMAAPPTPVPPTAVPPTAVPPTAALPTAAPPTAEPDSNWLSRNIRGALGVGQNILGAVTTPFEEFHQRVVIPSVSAKTKFMPLKWDPKEERSLLQNLTQAPQVTFDAFMKPGGGLDPGAFADFLQQFAAPPAQAMLSPAPIIREALNVPTESQGTVRAQRIEEEAQRREAETGVPLSQQERRQIGEGLYPLPPYVRGLTEELPYFAVPPARGVRTAMQAKRAALGLSQRFGRATPAVTKTIRAGEMGLKPIEIIEEMPRAVIGATARGIGRAGRLMGKTPGREAPLPPTPEKVPTPEVSSQAVGLTPDEVTQLGRLKTQLARDEAALGGILSDVEDVADVPTTPPTRAAAIGSSITDQFDEGLNARSMFEGGEVNPRLGYSWRSMGPAEYKKIIEGKSFGGPAKRGGYWSWFPGYSANLRGTTKRTKYMVEVEIPSSGESLKREGTLSDVRAVWKHEGKEWVPEPFPRTPFTEAKPTPTARTAAVPEATPIVKDLRASIQRGQDEISALEARSGVMDVPTADAGDIPTPGVTGEKWDLYTGEALRTASNELDRIIGNVPSTTTVKKPGITRAARDVKRVVYELLTEEDMSPTDRKNKIKYISEHTKPETPESLTELIDRARKEPKVGQEDFISEGTVETLEKSHVSRDLGRRLVERAYHVLPLSGRIKAALLSGLFTPASIMGLPGKKSVKEAVLYRILEEKHTARINYKLSWFMDNLPAVEKIAREGVDGTPFGDIAENPGRYLREGKIDQEAYEWITNAHKIIDDAADNYQYVTGKVLKVDLEREHYWPRFTKDGIDDYNKQGRLFKKVGPQKKRFHEYMKDGVEAGVDYEDAPMAQLQLYLGSVGKITRDAIFEQRLLSQEIAFKSVGKGEGKARVKAEWEGRPKGWGTLYFDEKDSRQIGIILGKKNKLLNLADVTSQVPKTIVAGTFDTGQFMLQSIGLLALSPERWGKAVYASIRTIFEPGYYHRYLNDIIPNETRAAANSGVDIGAVSEFYGSSGPSAKPPAERVVRKVPVIGSPLGGLISRMQGGFGAHIGVAKILMFDSMADVAIRTMPNPELRQQELLRIGRIVDSMLGGTSTKGLGVPATQRQVESAILFFAARYTRAVWATFGHALGSGVGADETRRILARMMWGGMLVISGLNGLMGTFEGKTRKEINKQILDSLNPTEGKKFMSVKVGSGYFGIGGGYRSALGFLTKTFTPGEWEEAELRDNPLYNYARSKMPITTATLADALEGEDFVGREFTYEAFTEDPSLILESLKDRLAPFPVQSFLEASSSGLPVQIGTGAAEFVGLRTVPGSTTEKQSEMIREWAKGLGPGSSYGDLAKFTGIEFPTTGPLAVSSEELAESPTDYWQFGKVARREMGKDPEYAALEERWEKDRKRWNRRSAEFYEKEERKEEEVYGSGGLLERLGEKSMEVDYEHPGEMYRIGKKKVLNDYYVLKDDRRLEAEKEGIFSEHEREGPIRQAEDRYNKLLYADDGSNEYIKEVERLTGRAYVPIDDPITGDVNWDEKDRRKDFLRNTYGQGFIDSMNYSDQELPEFERQYRRDFDYLDKQGYWNVEESLAKQAGLESELEEYKEAQRTDRVRARAIEKEPSDFNNMVLKKVTEGRRQLRIADPEIERIILYYYERKPASETGPRSLFERVTERVKEEEAWERSIRQ